MPLGFGSFEVARSGLASSERGLFTTGHNLSNVTTPGYVRQRNIMTSSAYIRVSMSETLGLGTDVQMTQQLRDTFLDALYRQEHLKLGYAQAKKDTYNNLEMLMKIDYTAEVGELGSELQSNLNELFNSWSELSKDPGSLTAMANTRQRADTLCKYLNEVERSLDKLQKDLDNEIIVKVQRVNSILYDIQQYNKQISEVEVIGERANDLNDKRNLLLDELSYLVDSSIFERENGMVDVYVGGYPIIFQNKRSEVTVMQNSDNSTFHNPAIADKDGNLIELPLKSGYIKGMIESRGDVTGYIGSYEDGYPCDSVDLVFAIDLNDTSNTRQELADNIDEIVRRYLELGINVRISVIKYDDNDVYEVEDFEPKGIINDTDLDNFKQSLMSGGQGTPQAINGSGGMTAIEIAVKNAVEALDLKNLGLDPQRTNSAFQFMVVTDGASQDITSASASRLVRYINESNKNIHLTIMAQNANPTYAKILENLAKATDNRFLSNVDLATSEDYRPYDLMDEALTAALFGVGDSTGNTIPDFRRRLNNIVAGIAREINSLHQSGYSFLGSDTESAQGLAFFVPINDRYPMCMGNIQVNPEIMKNLNLVVASSISDKKEDNGIAAAIADLRENIKLGKVGEQMNSDAYYRWITSTLGNEAYEASNLCDSQEILTNKFDEKRKSVSDVSIDEETTMMMKYQHAYGANARIMNVFDEMFDQIINRMGLVGR